MPHVKGVAGTAANFVMHVGERMDKDAQHVPAAAAFRPARGRHRREAIPDEFMATFKADYMVGLDVGSTTVKAGRRRRATDEILWQDYQRHETKQPEKVLEFLGASRPRSTTSRRENCRMFVTGSGGGDSPSTSAPSSCRRSTRSRWRSRSCTPRCDSVIELGGQDAKIIIFKDDPETGRKKKIPSMNDKCAGGTGAVIDKINAKLQHPRRRARATMGYHGVKLHPVAGKCGVFAETDINGLQKEGMPPDELMASLFEAIVLQNLSVLTRGNTLRPHVLLLGGPNTLHPRHARVLEGTTSRKMWEERKVAAARRRRTRKS